MPPLHRAIALAEMNGIAVAVAEHLNLDMTGIVDGAFEDDGGIAERRLRLRPCTAHGIAEGCSVGDEPHAAAATAGDRLDHHGEADLFGFRQHDLVALIGALIARHDGHAGLVHDLLGAGLVTHRRDRLRRRADEDQAGILAGLRKILVFGEETIAGMHCIRAAGFCGRNDRGDVEIGLRRQGFADVHGLVRLPHMERVAIRIRIDRDDAEAELPRASHHPQRDLAAIGDQNPRERPVLH
ncbi:hypothetical protein ACVWWP_008332 [Bradyrhizobium sp. LM3.6]